MKRWITPLLLLVIVLPGSAAAAAKPGGNPASGDGDLAGKSVACAPATKVPAEKKKALTGAKAKAVVKKKTAKAVNKCDKEPPKGVKSAPLSARDIAKMREYAQCVRARGFAAFPDPSANGLFRLGEEQARTLKSNPRFKAATQACVGLLPNGLAIARAKAAK